MSYVYSRRRRNGPRRSRITAVGDASVRPSSHTHNKKNGSSSTPMMLSGLRYNVAAAINKNVRQVLTGLEERISPTPPQGNNGFEELRKYIKQGGDFCKDITSVLQERSELEATYAKGLSKLANKVARASRDCVGTLAQGWQIVGSEMDAEGELHRNLALALIEELVKPLRNVIDSQHKTRKAVEAVVDKNAKILQDLRNSEVKSKKHCFVCAKENERLQEQVLESKVSKGRIMSDKDMAKMEGKQRKTEEAVKKADQEYYTVCIQAERARHEWETSIYRGSTTFQSLEEERISHMQEVVHKYTAHLSALGPKMIQGCERLSEAASCISVNADIQTIVAQKGTGHNIPEQILPDFYAEDLSNKMNKDRRREAIEKFILMLKHDTERERRGKQGVENLARVFHETPTFADEDAQQEVHEKIQHMKAMLTYFEATRYKLQCSLSDIENRTRPTHPLKKHMEQYKDKQGMMHTILKVPSWVRSERRNSDQSSQNSDSPDMRDRGPADGTSMLPDNYDEFSNYSQDSGPIYGNLKSIYQQLPTNGRVIARCKAIYEYEANMYDELTIRPGDTINVYDKLEDGWWQGELNGNIGIFPATYVEELK